MRRTKEEVKAEIAHRLDELNRKRARIRKNTGICVTLVIVTAVTLTSARILTGYMKNDGGGIANGTVAMKGDAHVHQGAAAEDIPTTVAPSNDFLLGGSKTESQDETTAKARGNSITHITLISVSGIIEIETSTDITMLLSALKRFTPADEMPDNATFKRRVEFTARDSDGNRYSILYGNGLINSDGKIYTSADNGEEFETLLTKLGLEY